MSTQNVTLIGGPLDGQQLSMQQEFLDGNGSARIQLIVPPEDNRLSSALTGRLSDRREIAVYDRVSDNDTDHIRYSFLEMT